MSGRVTYHPYLAESRVQHGQLGTQQQTLNVNSKIAKNTAKFKGGVFIR